jgi:PBP1b-binding outer membrane lipoprotein LpoB
MKYNKQYVIFMLVAILFSSCAKVFYSPDAYKLAHNQNLIAIIPPTVSIAAKKKFDAEAMKEQAKTESINFQNEMYSWMLKRKMQGKISQEIQEIETTNAKLKKAGYPANP